MTPEEKSIVERFAAGDKSLRLQAIAAARRAGLAHETRTTHDAYMAEIDTPVPDLLLRRMAHAALIAEVALRQSQGETDERPATSPR